MKSFGTREAADLIARTKATMEDGVQGRDRDLIKDRADVLSALLSPASDASRAVVRRTRFAVRDTSIGLDERRTRQRRNTGWALLALFVLLILLTPEIWSSVEDLVAGEHLADFSCQAAISLLMLVPAMLAALAAISKEHWNKRREGSDF